MSYSFHVLKVLVVDDNQRMRTMLTIILKAFGIKEIYNAGSADEAWKVFSTRPVDVIVLDWEMDGTSGLELIQRIRTVDNSPNPFVPIVMLTSHGSIERVQAARDAGVNEFLAKPFSSSALMSRFVSVIEYPRPFVRTKSYFGPCRRRRNNDGFHGPERRTTESEVVKPPAQEKVRQQKRR